MNPQQTQPVQQQPVAPAQHYNAPMQQQPRRSRGWLPWTVLAIAIIVILGILVLIFHSKLFPSKASADKLSGYQAVFLTNGQVYFGKISHTNNDYVELTSIYYLQVNQALQADGTPATTPAANTAAGANSTAANQSTQLSLVKLGNELHGPSDKMQINRDQILFYEDLKEDGQVAQAISKYQQSGGTAGATNSNPAQGTSQAPAATNGTGTSTVPTTTTGTSANSH